MIHLFGLGEHHFWDGKFYRCQVIQNSLSSKYKQHVKVAYLVV